MRHPGDLARLTREYLAAAAAHHVRYAEFFWNPTGTARDSGIGYTEGLAAICEAIADAEKLHGISGRLIPAIDREASLRDALEMVQWVVDAQRAHPRPEVVGIAAWVDEGTKQRWAAAFDAGFEAALQAENAPSAVLVGEQKAH